MLSALSNKETVMFASFLLCISLFIGGPIPERGERPYGDAMGHLSETGIEGLSVKAIKP